MSVSSLLNQAGLQHLIPAFNHLPIERFKSLLIQDYDKFGISEIADKQALFRLIQELNADDLNLTLSPEPGHNPQASSRAQYEGYQPNRDDAFLDLEDDEDDDMFGEDLDAEAFSEEFIRSTTMSALAPSPLQHPPAHQQQHQMQQQQHHYTQQASQPQQQQSDITNGIATINLGTTMIVDPPRIRVIVRKRPLNKKETDRGDSDVIECDEPGAGLFVNEPRVKVDLTKYVERHNFRFDDVFGEQISNDELYVRAIQPLISTIFRGGKATCFAYGQTGSGKTFTMAPLPLRAAADVFRVMSEVPAYREVELLVSCYEIYGGKVFDLLNKRNKLEVREDAKKRVQVVGLKESDVNSVQILMQLCDLAAASRSTGSTGANDESSRSHSIMCFALKCPGSKPGSKMTLGKLSFIDLAGSERGADTYDNDKQTRMEGAEINKSLLALKECIRALDSDASYIPFRGSKLTSVLRDSFIGDNTRTVMIGCVSPNSTSCEHTLNTLRYADRVKEIRKDSKSSSSHASLTAGIDRSNSLNMTTAEALGMNEQEAATAEHVANILQSTHLAAAVSQQQQQQALPPAPAPVIQPPQQQQQPAQPKNTTPRQAPVPTPPSPGRVPGSGIPHAPTSRLQQPSPATAPSPRQNGTASAAVAAFNSQTRQRQVSPGNSGTNQTTSDNNRHSSPSSDEKITSPMQRHAALRQAAKGQRRSSGSTSVAAHPLLHVLSDASTACFSANSEDDQALNALVTAEEELIGAHRQHIEESMLCVKEEMELLAKLDNADGNGDIECYIDDLSHVLMEKQAKVALLQQQVSLFRRRMKAVFEAAAAANAM